MNHTLADCTARSPKTPPPCHCGAGPAGKLAASVLHAASQTKLDVSAALSSPYLITNHEMSVEEGQALLASTAKPVPKSFRRPHKDFPTAERVKAGFMRARRYSRVIVALALAVGLVLGGGVRGRVAFRGRRD